MPSKDFFPQRPVSHPMVYAYSDSNPQYAGLLKVGYTEKKVHSAFIKRINLGDGDDD